MVVQFILNEVSIRIQDRKRLKQNIINLFEREGKPLCSLTYIFCTDEYLLGINCEFLQHTDFTDVITFTLSEPEQPVIGEVYISVDRIKENASIYKVSNQIELHRVIFHGALHLCGYRDKSKGDILEMRAAEEYNLKIHLG